VSEPLREVPSPSHRAYPVARACVCACADESGSTRCSSCVGPAETSFVSGLAGRTASSQGSTDREGVLCRPVLILRPVSQVQGSAWRLAAIAPTGMQVTGLVTAQRSSCTSETSQHPDRILLHSCKDLPAQLPVCRSVSHPSQVLKSPNTSLPPPPVSQRPSLNAASISATNRRK
jgi:hypothetical protein